MGMTGHGRLYRRLYISFSMDESTKVTRPYLTLYFSLYVLILSFLSRIFKECKE